MAKVDRRTVDIQKVKNGEMTIEEFCEKYGINIDEIRRTEE